MIETKQYNDTFFDEMEASSYRSAREVLPYLHKIFPFKSVIDIGCGTGVWLKVCQDDLAITDFKGIEGPYLKKEKLKVNPDNVQFTDLKQELKLDRKYDLVISMEVGEHLPDSSSANFVKSLANAGDFILFSAALPGQEGTYHINEQFPEYWATKFIDAGFTPVDVLRKYFWNNAGVDWWYRQNMMLYIKKEVLPIFPELQKAAACTDPEFLTRIHPEIFELKTRHIEKINSFPGFLGFKWYQFKSKFLK
jgi:SAM-dependent methyltransferase